MGLLSLLGGTVAFTAAAVAGTPGWVWIGLMGWSVCSLAVIVGSASSLALGEARHAAGTTTALMGLMQSILGAIGVPLVGLGGGADALPMALVMVLAAIAANTAFMLARRA